MRIPLKEENLAGRNIARLPIFSCHLNTTLNLKRKYICCPVRFRQLGENMWNDRAVKMEAISIFPTRTVPLRSVSRYGAPRGTDVMALRWRCGRQAACRDSLHDVNLVSARLQCSRAGCVDLYRPEIFGQGLIGCVQPYARLPHASS